MIEFILAFSLLFIVYTYVGYPVFIWIMAKSLPGKINKQCFFPDLTIVFSVFNEENNLKNKISNCLSMNYPKNKIHVLIASDGSTDNTPTLLEKYDQKYSNVTSLIFSLQRGKAACINDAITQAKTDFVVLTDARQEFNGDALRELIANFSDENVGAVSGELKFKQADSNDYAQGINIYWKYEKFIRKNESLYHSSVGVSGAIYAIRKKLYQKIPENCILDDVLIPMKIIKQKYRVVFEEKAIAYDIPSNNIQREKKRKTRTIAGNYQLLQLDKSLLNPYKNNVLIQFISHKLFRLLVPVFLLLAFISNAFLFDSHWFYQFLFFCQLLFYLAPLINRILPLPSLASTIANGANAFLSLNYFAVLGFVEFIKNKNIHIWK